MRMRCLLALLLSAAWFTSVVAAVSPPIPPYIPHRDDMVKHAGKAQDRGTTAKWAAILGGVSVFSHIRYGHIAINLYAFPTNGSDAVDVLGDMRFAHLYLISSLCSSGFSCLWHECGMTSSRALGSLGASGAISGVISWVYLHTWKRGGKTFVTDEKAVHPLMVLLFNVGKDVSGLFEFVLLRQWSKRGIKQCCTHWRYAWGYTILCLGLFI
jgi:membrane associated rhomboid family serine protease